MKKRPLYSVILILGSIILFFIGLSLLMLSFTKEGPLWSRGEKVGVIEVKGVIADAQETLKQLDKYRKNSQIKAIVLRINSPGGAVSPAQEIWRELEKVRKTKKVVASLGTVAASGGYYIASGADLIIASPGTLTGSIGVIIRFANVEDLIKKVGLDFYDLKAGTFKDSGSPVRPMTPEERAYFQKLLDNIHEQFIRDVAKGRNLPVEKVRAVADGRIFTGEEAKKLKMIDEFGNLQDAIERAGRLGGIVGKVEAIYPEKDKFSLWQLLFGESLEKTFNRLQLTPLIPAYLLTRR
ncbi:MAG: signal peptide peptidase SppA [Deltaproteobacteria bacterium]|nr:signal peptide peptidase SppA [Deltaproteobacteria bacterium]MBW1952610.1 signal peptide peptidase SppA [Deltaproteobacteria bacterium]MBW1986263.1 signal peptide peptidase SppA [Deltaproteobacteria bacterium]MBW2134160.1 signal peptide peptidase SppA [Deltaproteobacteria bacterium]